MRIHPVVGLSLLGVVLLSGVPASAHERSRICVDSDGDRVRCNYPSRICRDSDGDRVPCGRRYYNYEPNYRPSYYGAYRQYDSAPGFSLRIGPSRGYYNW